MIKAISEISKAIETCINEFWSGITTIDPQKLLIDGYNIQMLYLYIVLKARIPNMFAYMKIMEEFSTNYVRSISRYGYCMTTLEVVMEMLQTHTLNELI